MPKNSGGGGLVNERWFGGGGEGFELSQYRRIALKIVDDRRIESLEIIEVE
jgi:hypothetical protein